VQKTYTPEFKREAVQLVQTSGKPIAQVARELGISDSSIHQWRKELAEHGSEAFPGSGQQTAQEEEVRRLKRELDVVKIDELKRRKLDQLGCLLFQTSWLILPQAMLPMKLWIIKPGLWWLRSRGQM
jgi:transposase